MTVYTIEENPQTRACTVYANDKNIGQFASRGAAEVFIHKAQAASAPTRQEPANENTAPQPDVIQLLSWAAYSLNRLADAMAAQTKILAAVYSDIPQEERNEEVKKAIKHTGE